MRASPTSVALIYFLMGAMFTYIAIDVTEDTIWNFSTIALMIVATFDFTAAIRLLALHFRIHQRK